ncbi:hypothetical protein PP707_07085, partial [Acetobacter pasteurianus]|nr:hypothetical protein [Acetobacter pasteurianus]
MFYTLLITTSACLLSAVLYRLFVARSLELERVKQQLDHHVKSTAEASDAKVLQLQKELKDLQSELELTLGKLKKEKVDLESKTSELSQKVKSLVDEEASTQGEHTKLIKQITRKEEELLNVRADLRITQENARKLEQEYKFKFNTQMESFLVEKDARIAELEVQEADWKSQVTNLTKELAINQKTLYDAKSSIKRLEQTIQEAEKNKAKLEQEKGFYIAENNENICKIELKTRELEELKQNYESLQSDYEKASKDLQHSEQVVIDTEKIVEDLKVTQTLLNTQLTKEKEQQKEQQKELLEQVNDLESKVREKDQLVQELETELAPLKDFYRQYTEYTDSLKKSDTEFSELSTTNVSTPTQSSMSDISELQKYIVHLKEEVNNLQENSTNVNKSGDKNSNQNNIQNPNPSISQLKRQVETLNTIKDKFEKHSAEEISKNLTYLVALKEFKKVYESKGNKDIDGSQDVVQNLEKLIGLNNESIEFNTEARDELK